VTPRVLLSGNYVHTRQLIGIIRLGASTDALCGSILIDISPIYPHSDRASPKPEERRGEANYQPSSLKATDSDIRQLGDSDLENQLFSFWVNPECVIVSRDGMLLASNQSINGNFDLI